MNALQHAMDAFLKNTDIQKLKKASENITRHYRLGESLTIEEELLAYLIVRLPATCAAISAVLKNIPPPGSILDLGAGPGTLFWACKSIWDTLPIITAVERESTFIELGTQLGAQVKW